MTNRIRHFRLRAGLTQAQLANLARLTIRTICAAEGGRSVRHGNQRRILHALGLSWQDRDLVFPPEGATEQLELEPISEGRWDPIYDLDTETIEHPALCDVPRVLAWRRRHERVEQAA